jgi:hypothetical protein
MRTVLLVMVASLAGACVVEEPVGEVSWSEAKIESQVEPDIDPIVWRPSCHHHYECCDDTKLGTTYDDPNHTRCLYCAKRCDEEGQWPRQTFAGRDCQYWKKKYELRKPRPECR